MSNKRPHVVVFFGGTSGSHDLSSQTGHWVCQYIPRSKYQVTPVHITTDGRWQVPLGSLPKSGSIDRAVTMLMQAVPALPPPQAMQRLLYHPVDAFLTVVRGPGGDDGATHRLGQLLSIPVVGSPAEACQHTANKQTCALLTEDITTAPVSYHLPLDDDVESAVDSVRQQLMPPLFVKPAAEEGSVGVEEIQTVDELRSALQRAKHRGEALVQERTHGQEIVVTVVQDANGHLRTLPATVVIPKKTTFYDHLSKRRPGRVRLATTTPADSLAVAEAEAIARDVFFKLRLRGLATVDMVASDAGVDLLEVNVIPTLTDHTPLKHQLQAAGLRPSVLFDRLIEQALDGS